MEQTISEKIRNGIPKSIGLEFSDQADRMRLVIREPYQPLRSDAAAFEAWVLFAHVQSVHTKIVMDIAPLTETQYESRSFKQFLYRTAKFLESGYSWFSLSAELMQRTHAFMKQYLSREKTLRLPRLETAGARGKGERILQTKFSASDSILYALPECEEAALHTEFPVDLFWGAKRADMTAENRVFPRSSSGLDLWCAKEKTLCIFLLNYQKTNASLISELFFYAHWCRDVFVANNECHIMFPKAPARPARGCGDLFEGAQKRPFSLISASFLSDIFHPIMEFGYICEMLSVRDIRFHMLKYSWDMPLTLDHNKE